MNEVLKVSEDNGSYLTLKWGTLKAWNFPSEKGKELLRKYNELGSNPSAAMQKDSPEQKQIICELIDECTDPQGIFLDWDDKYVSKEEAKAYVMSAGA